MERCYLLVFQTEHTEELCLRPNQSTEEGEPHTCRTLISLRSTIKDAAASFFLGQKLTTTTPSAASVVEIDEQTNPQKKRECEVVFHRVI